MKINIYVNKNKIKYIQLNIKLNEWNKNIIN